MRPRFRKAWEGAYEAPRAAALSGVPVSTVYHWAKEEIIVPSISPVRKKLWSYADLMALRIVYWLRHPKPEGDDELRASPMSEVRAALGRLEELGIDIWDPNEMPESPLVVDRSGRIYIKGADGIVDADGRPRLDVLDLLGPFDAATFQGPDLRSPRPHLRIVPGKCSGEPHLAGSRITTLTLTALAKRGYSTQDIASLYPDEEPPGIAEAIDLEQQLATNAQRAA